MGMTSAGYDDKTEWFDGKEWHLAEPGKEPSKEPFAYVTYAQESSPETGHEEWCWLVAGTGKMGGDEPSAEAAKAAAEAHIRERVQR